MATNENNRITVVGFVASEAKFSHDVFGEKFYEFKMAIPRESGASDILPVLVSERLFDIEKIIVNEQVRVDGQIRTINKTIGEKSKLVLFIFAKELEIVLVPVINNINNATIDGYICKQPIYRETPLGREIAELMIAVNRPYNKSDYIPCIAWGRNAKYMGGLKVGTRVKLCGRLQSREYLKTLEDGSSVVRTAYELSVYRLEMEE